MSFAQSQSVPYPQSPDPTLNDPQWLQQLASHPIFRSHDDTTPMSASTDPTSSMGSPSVHPRLMASRGTDLIVVVNNEIRITSLVDAKASAVSSYPLSPSLGPSSISNALSGLTYKVLTSATSRQDSTPIDFEIRHLSVNPTGKLLACIGDNQISVLVLPRTGYTKHVDQHIACKAALVGPYYHSQHASTTIAKVSWHPWGDAGTSLLVLTDDGLLREYDVAKDTEEPQQTASFLPLSLSPAAPRSRSTTPTAAYLASSSSPSTHRFRSGSSQHGFPASHSMPPSSSFGMGLSADDEDARIAVSFALCVTHAPTSAPTSFENQEKAESWVDTQGISRPADWSCLTVYGLMKNGDIWAICPFLPKNAIVPAPYIHSLAESVSIKVNEGEDAGSHTDMQLRFLHSLLRQAPSSRSNRARSASVTPGPEQFARSRSTSTMDLDQMIGSTPQPAASNSDEALRDRQEELIQDLPLRFHPPSWSYSQNLRAADRSSVKKAPRPQGPFLLKPAPIELCDERESSACDVLWSWLSNETATQPGRAADAVKGVGMLAVVGHDGRVDIGLLLSSVEASWGSTNRASSASNSRRKNTKPVKTNRYGLSDTEDEVEDDFDAMTLQDPDLPSLLMYETIDLGLLEAAQDSGLASQSEASDFLLRSAERNRPCFVQDPLYRDTAYVYHSLGAQCLGFARWAQKLINVLNLPSEDDFAREANGASETREQALVKLLHQGDCTEVVWVVKTATQSTEEKATNSSKSISVNPITAITILSDVYLSYAFLSITQDRQLVAVELALRVEMDPASAVQSDSHSDALNSARKPISGESKPYVSLLGKEASPFQLPSLFTAGSTLQGLPAHPQRAAARSGLAGGNASSIKSEIKITPEVLRSFGKAVETYRLEIRDVVNAGNQVQARLDLQMREMARQLETLESIRSRTDQLLGGRTQKQASSNGKETLEARLHRIHSTQNQLLARIDRSLQRLMDHHQPSLSIYEKQWFEELNVLAGEVGLVGVPNDKGNFVLDSRNKKSLIHKKAALEHQMSLLRPKLQELQQQQQRQHQTKDDTKGVLGAQQLKKVEAMLVVESKLLQEAKEKVTELNGRIAKIQPGVVARRAVDAADESYSRDSAFEPSGMGGSGGIPRSSTVGGFSNMSGRRGYSRSGSMGRDGW